MSLHDNHANLPLGRIPDTHRASDLRFASYWDKNILGESMRDDRVPPRLKAPTAVNWKSFSTPSGARPRPSTSALGNDRKGCCVYSAPGHMINMIGQQIGRDDLWVTAEMVLAEYDFRTGGVDQGYYIRVMLEQWLTEGLFGTQLEALCVVNKDDPEEVAQATWVGCGLIGGYDLPLEAQGQVDEQGRQLWFVPAGGWTPGRGPGSWGGHALWTRGTSPGIDDFVSWGENTEATVEWRRECCSELYLPLVKEWRLGTGRAPNGFAFDDLIADVRARA